MKKQKINRTINKRINTVMDLAEAIFIDDRRLPIFRRQLLNQLNELRRELTQHQNSSNNMEDTVVTAFHDSFAHNPLAERVWRG